MTYSCIAELIGNTPIVKLNRLPEPGGAQVYVKLEFFNPGGSIKDRAALNMITEAEITGKLKKGMTIIEPTSGNMGIGLAMAGAVKGYKVILVMPDTMSIERRKLVSAFGAEVILTPGELGMGGSVTLANKMASKNPNYFMPQQFENSANPIAHKNSTALEIIEQMDSKLDVFVCGIGTGGTITGVGEVLKDKLGNVMIVAVEPAGSPILSGGKPGPHKIQGIGANFIPGVLNMDIIDRVFPVTDEQAITTARLMAKEEGLLVGISSGASVCAALKIAENLDGTKKVLAIAPDTGERYLSTDLFEEKVKEPYSHGEEAEHGCC
jgi:cysteine synthase A